MGAVFEVGAFGVFSFIAVAGALGMATTMSMFRSGVFLMASFVGVAGLFILLSADLIGLLQVMMYLGGMLVMILFMVLFMHDPGGAMMAGMEGLAPPERWFSMGLVPRSRQSSGRGQENGGHGDGQHENAGDHGHGSGHEHDNGDGGHGGSGQQMDMSMVTPVRPLAAWLALSVGIGLIAMLIARPAWRIVEGTPDPDSASRVGHLLMEKYMIGFEGAGLLILTGIFGAVLLARASRFPDDPGREASVAVDRPPSSIDESPYLSGRSGGRE